ncbi:3-deoxy-7-phosphoheptulonate synthase [Schizophyllum commune H4-8]|uniref:3-deoxy-7-phosphoheptulonate synthase n=1 Tax=Schizophyllum commune (strain H4-8 / FGSC 9210) TaxID=578458 RepID=UPI00215F592C|nr:3-deoxy-7-phosphoheptulonate synthase [Schizophyllum commune H4-8]KAI5887981.1 3-deoxy-7-phosphoheptulonate synthase [Schizophyllum commune H4-8]
MPAETQTPFRFPVHADPASREVSDAGQDRRIIGYAPLIQPLLLIAQHPASPAAQDTVARGRREAAGVVSGKEQRLLVIVGPCSIHDVDEALTYARRLRGALDAGRWPELVVVMRAYFEKPRTTVGWKGLINDPGIDGGFRINEGLATARALLCAITDLGVPVGAELLDTVSPQFLSDLTSWAAIGARTTESQLHRELASGCSFPVGFKNGTDGGVTVAIDAMHSASHPHAFMGVTPQGLASIVKTTGNPHLHVILRGGTGGPNYGAEDIRRVVGEIRRRSEREKDGSGGGGGKERFASVMVDCSHGNSQKDYRNQPKVLHSLCQTIAGEGLSANGEVEDTLDIAPHITGVMIESNINEGRQDVPVGVENVRAHLKPGVSITDGCVSWETTVGMLDELNAAVAKRNKRCGTRRVRVGRAFGWGAQSMYPLSILRISIYSPYPQSILRISILRDISILRIQKAQLCMQCLLPGSQVSSHSSVARWAFHSSLTRRAARVASFVLLRKRPTY